jgi:gas vesicle protein
MSDDIFDFGFTAVDETELEAVQKATATAETASSTAEEMQEKIDKLYNAVTPLLNNLKANPEKEYIYWPNRIDKVEQFETYLYDIYKK